MSSSYSHLALSPLPKNMKHITQCFDVKYILTHVAMSTFQQTQAQKYN